QQDPFAGMPANDPFAGLLDDLAYSDPFAGFGSLSVGGSELDNIISQGKAVAPTATQKVNIASSSQKEFYTIRTGELISKTFSNYSQNFGSFLYFGVVMLFALIGLGMINGIIQLLAGLIGGMAVMVVSSTMWGIIGALFMLGWCSYSMQVVRKKREKAIFGFDTREFLLSLVPITVISVLTGVLSVVLLIYSGVAVDAANVLLVYNDGAHAKEISTYFFFVALPTYFMIAIVTTVIGALLFNWTFFFILDTNENVITLMGRSIGFWCDNFISLTIGFFVVGTIAYILGMLCLGIGVFFITVPLIGCFYATAYKMAVGK
ncbi:MAG: hypothetical protein ACRC2T_16605, partial [Thermoguttaceae bacterium]